MSRLSDVRWRVQILVTLKCVCCCYSYGNRPPQGESELPPFHPSPGTTG